MTEFQAAVEAGDLAKLKEMDAKGQLSGEERQIVARLTAKTRVEAPAEEPKPKRVKDSEPEPKAEKPKVSRRSAPAGSGKKGK